MSKGYHRAMLDDPDNDAPAFDPPDAEGVYRNYVETCRRLGVESVPRDRAEELMAEWSDAIAAGRTVPPTTHNWRPGTPS